MKKSYDSIDLTKFFMSILVVVLHTDAFLDVNPWLNMFVAGGVARLAVPFFFVTSAYFFFSKPVTKASVHKYCRRLLNLYVAWFIVSIPKTIFDRFLCSSESFGVTLFRFVRSFFFTSTFSGSWFITACIFCALLFYYLSKQPHRKYVVITTILSAIAYFWSVFASAYGNLMDDVGLAGFYKRYEFMFANPYTSIIVGIPYFALGKYFSEKRDTLTAGSRETVGTVIGVLLLLTEVYVTASRGWVYTTDCYLSLLPCIFFLFPLILNWKVSLKHASWYRVASTIIFFSQFWLLFLCEIAEWILKITIPCLGKFAFALAASLALTVFVLSKAENPKWKWLKYFY